MTSVSRLTFCTCLSCVGWDVNTLFYRHGADGQPLGNIGDAAGSAAPEFPSGPFLATRAWLVPTPERWRWQETNGRENLHRVGGHPTWVQSAEYPSCPECAATMPFLMQLDSNLPTEDDGDFLWGSGGTAYLHWCDPCRVSAMFWQCT